MDKLVYVESSSEIYADVDDGCGNAFLVAAIAGDLADEGTHRVGRILAAAPAMFRAIESFMPAGVAIGNGNVPDDIVIPMDVTMGELRAFEAALKEARGQ